MAANETLESTPPLRLRAALEPLLGADGELAVSRTGPRRWWQGPLDVEGLALGSAEAVAVALGALGGDRATSRISLDSSVVAASFGSFEALRVDGAQREGFAPLSGFHRTADGWVRLHANYPHHERALFEAIGESDRDGLVAELSRRAGADVEERVTAHGGLAAVVRKHSEWLDTPSAAALRGVPWIRFARSSSGDTQAFTLREWPRPLHGLRVLDLTRVIAGPSATRLLGALGADVLRVDPPGIPELWDLHVDTGFDKRSAIADLGDRATRERLHTLLAAADIVVLGYRPCALGRYGFDPVSLREAHPRLAVVALEAWGATGPHAGKRGFDSIVQAATGISHLYGSGVGDDWRPGALPVQALDHATGQGMAAAALALLRARENGQSGIAYVSLARTALELLTAEAPADRPGQLSAVELREAPSPYGALQFVPPPLTIDGRQLEYASAPEEYGASPLRWQSPNDISG